MALLLDFAGEQVGIQHQKFDDLSLTWNTIDPIGHATWSDGDDPGCALHLRWRTTPGPN